MMATPDSCRKGIYDWVTVTFWTSMRCAVRTYMMRMSMNMNASIENCYVIDCPSFIICSINTTNRGLLMHVEII